jgi:N-acetylneuraminate synthase
MYVSYAKGARTWERHIDIDYNNVPVSPYSSLPEQIDTWFKAFNKAQEMSGGSSEIKRIITQKEIHYLDQLVRGIYLKRDLPDGYEIDHNSFSEDFQMAVPLLKGQLSTREILNGTKLTRSIKKDEPLTVSDIDGPLNKSESLKNQILNRGV